MCVGRWLPAWCIFAISNPQLPHLDDPNWKVGNIAFNYIETGAWLFLREGVVFLSSLR
jgi:hypothetical protein